MAYTLIARAWMTGLHYGMDYITELDQGIRLRDYIMELYYSIILEKHVTVCIMESYHKNCITEVYH